MNKICYLFFILFFSACGGNDKLEKREYENNIAVTKSTKEFLIESGFTFSEKKNCFVIERIKLIDASKQIGFDLNKLKNTPGQHSHEDVRTIEHSEKLFFIVESLVSDDKGRIISGSLDDQNAICEITAVLTSEDDRRQQK